MINLEDSAADIQSNMADHIDGYALQSYFCRSDLVYQLEQQTIAFKSWLLAGHTSQIEKAGDFIQFEVAGESVIICRDKADGVHALLNVCRHRGARVCELSSGNSFAFTCPYHGWVYDLDGSLKAARDFEGLDYSNHGLKKIRLEVYEGLIFINFDPQASNFADELDLIKTPLASFDLSNAKVAVERTYTVSANWKLTLENYLECYHCATAHRSYAKSHTLKALYSDVVEINEKMLENSARLTGVEGLGRESFHAYTEAATVGGGVDSSRYALYDGYDTGSEDGKPLAPLMGHYQGYDGGAADFQFGPLAFMLGYPDHCVFYRFTPRSKDQTDMTVIWMVRADAIEGRDYDIDKLTWLWHTTSQEDEYIISRNAAGVASNFFTPGPYHPEHEALCIKFTRWYLERLRSGMDNSSL